MQASQNIVSIGLLRFKMYVEKIVNYRCYLCKKVLIIYVLYCNYITFMVYMH